jgi:undecaprenyl-diphosphatase
VAVLAYLVRTSSQLIGIDNSVAKWANGHASALSTHGLNLITQLGSIYTVVALCLVLAVVETRRTRSVSVVLFIIAVVGGEEILTNTIKQLADRARPTFNPAAAALGPSFPSGHAATAAAFYAGAALLLGRQRLRPTRAVLAGLGRDCSRSGRQPRAPRRSLAVRRDRGSGARLGLAGGLLDRLRRPPPFRRHGRLKIRRRSPSRS